MKQLVTVNRRSMQTMQQLPPLLVPDMAANASEGVKESMRKFTLDRIADMCYDLLLAGRCQEAENLLQKYYRSSTLSPKMPLPIPTLPLANAFIEAYLQKDTLVSNAQAKQILTALGTKANDTSYGYFIRHYIQRKDLKSAREVLQLMEKQSFTGTRGLSDTGIFTRSSLEKLKKLGGSSVHESIGGEFAVDVMVEDFVIPEEPAAIAKNKPVVAKKTHSASVTPIPSSSNSLGFIKRSLHALTSHNPESNSHAELVELQKRIESDCLKEAVAKLREEWEKFHTMSSGSANPIGSKWIISKWAHELADAIKALNSKHTPTSTTPHYSAQEEEDNSGWKFLKPAEVYGTVLGVIEPERVALIVLQQLLKMSRYSFEMGAVGDSARSLWPGCKYTTLCGDIGRSLEHEICAEQITSNSFIKRYAHLLYKKRNPQEEEEAAEKSKKAGMSLLDMSMKVRMEQSLLRGKTRSQTVRGVQEMLGKDEQSLKSGWLATWDQDKRMRYGAFCLDLALRTLTNPDLEETGVTPFIHQVIRNPFTPDKKLGVVRINRKHYDRFTEESGALMEHLGVEPWCLPMVVPPRPWLAIDAGGYLSHKLMCVRTRDDLSHLALLDHADKSGALQTLYKGLDYLGSTAWRINNRVLNVAVALWEKKRDLSNLSEITNPNLELYGFRRKEEFQSHEEYVAYVQRATNHRKSISERHSIMCDINYKLEIASSYSGHRFYFPHNVDFRGRAYPVPPHLNHLGSDLSRGLLLFAEGKRLNGEEGLKWLKVQLANMLGKDKLTFTERVAYVDQNMPIIRQVAANPLDEAVCDFWMKADEPWQSLAACIEVAQAVEDPINFESRLPVQQDGSCNGLQHYAALGGDVWGASQVNLLPSERPQDIYATVAQLVKEELAKLSDDPIAQKLKEVVPITRKIVKTPVMTNVYGVTAYGARKQIASNIKELHGDVLGKDLSKASGLLATLVFKALDGLFVQARRIQDWLTHAAVEIGHAVPPNAQKDAQGSLVTWTSPIGFPVIQPYHKRHDVHLKTAVQTITLTCPDSTRIDAHKQAAGFPPNYVHSLDASHMFLTALRCAKQGITFASVHDCYWTHAGSVPDMARELREAFVELHGRSLLEELRDELMERYEGYTVVMSNGTKREFALPPVPSRGPLDITQVKESLYFFS